MTMISNQLFLKPLIPSINPKLDESDKSQYYPDLVRPYPYDDDDLDEEGGEEY